MRARPSSPLGARRMAAIGPCLCFSFSLYNLCIVLFCPVTVLSGAGLFFPRRGVAPVSPRPRRRHRYLACAPDSSRATGGELPHPRASDAWPASLASPIACPTSHPVVLLLSAKGIAPRG